MHAQWLDGNHSGIATRLTNEEEGRKKKQIWSVVTVKYARFSV